MNKDIPVVLLCGGKGTRLREKTGTIPKPMVEIGGKPIIWHIMKSYSYHGFNRFILCLGYKGHVIKDYFLNYELMQSDVTIDFGNKGNISVHDTHCEDKWEITLANTGEENMTGSRIKQIEKYINSEHFLLTYGDGVCDVDINRLVDFHQSHGNIGTVTGVHPPSRFGELFVEKNKVKQFSEKPQASEGRINGGYFVFNSKIFNYVSRDLNCVFEREPLESVANDGELMMYQHDGFWQCMDTLRDMEYLEKLWQQNKSPWKKWGKEAVIV